MNNLVIKDEVNILCKSLRIHNEISPFPAQRESEEKSSKIPTSSTFFINSKFLKD